MLTRLTHVGVHFIRGFSHRILTIIFVNINRVADTTLAHAVRKFFSATFVILFACIFLRMALRFLAPAAVKTPALV